MKSKKTSLIVIALVLMSTILACTISVGGPDYPDETIPIATESVVEMQAAIQTAVAGVGENGQVTIVISEVQLTSFLAEKLSSQPDALLQNPQAFLREGQIRIYGTARSGYFEATASIVLAPAIDEEGKLSLELVSADFGPLPVPEGLKSAIAAIVTEAYTGSLGPAATGFRLESVIIANGYMMLIGRVH
jgi:uncharacterized protein YpmS